MTTADGTSGIEGPAIRSGALALVSAATALGFARVFDSGGFAPLLLLAAVLPHLVGLLGRIRQWTTMLTVSVMSVVTAIALLWIVAGETTAYGLPTPASAARLGHMIDVGWGVFRTGVAPVAPGAGVLLLCAAVMAFTAATADTIARRPGVTIGALVPTLVVFVLTGTLGTGARRIPTTVAYVVAALFAIVIADAARVARRRSWFTGHRLASNAALIRSAVSIGGIAVLVGLVLTPVVPGVGSPALLRYRTRSGTGGGGGSGDYQTVSPLVDLRSRLGPRRDVELFRVGSPRPLNWRLVALDRFDGRAWSIASRARDAAATFRPLPEEDSVRQRYSISALGDRWVPAAFTPVNTTLGNARIIPESSILIAPNPISGQDYEVRSRVETPPTPTEVAATDRPVSATVRAALELPSDFPSSIRDQARQITAGAGTPYAKAQALEQFFTDGSFVYDLDAPAADDTEAIATFLRLRRGFCQQFAAAFAALARASGLPSRVVVGFTPGEHDPKTDDYVVRGRNAHAWAEVWFAGLGWRSFEPTPAGTEPGQADTRASTTPPPPGGASGTTAAPFARSTVPNATSGADAPRAIPKSETAVSTRHASGPGTRNARSIALVGLLILAVGTFGGLLLARFVSGKRIRRGRRRAAEPAIRITGAWRDALEACAGTGLPISRALTPREQIGAIARHGVASGAVSPLRDLADLYTDAEFSPHPPDMAASERAWAAASEIRAALLVDVGPRERAARVVRTTFARDPGFDDAPPDPSTSRPRRDR